MADGNKKIGLLTYHSAYNFGSVLQAYATQFFVTDNFPKVNFELINYRMKEQKDYYALIRKKYGVKTFLRDVFQFPIYKKRKKRVERFEEFINNRFMLTDEYSEPEQIMKIWNRYSVLISGSDQIWNKHSCELHRNDWKYMIPYLLRTYRGKKISYASSFGNMSDDEIDCIVDDIRLFDNIAMRESHSAKCLGYKLNKNIANVLDPTFLLNKEDWIKVFNLKRTNEKYIFYYSLSRDCQQSIQTLKEVITFAKRKKCKLKVITPYMYLYENIYKNVENCGDMGPIEFLDCIYNATAVITDSFHGTVLSVNFEKDLYTIEITKGSDLRTTDILKSLGISHRLLYTSEELNTCEHDKIDYKKVEKKLNILREKSKLYLIGSITEALK